MGTGRSREDKERERRLETQANQAVEQIQPSAYQKFQEPKDLAALEAWDSGKDVRNIDAFRGHLNLFDNANLGDEELAGAGLLGNNQLAGTNSKQLGLIAQQLKDRRMQQNQGNLYNAINQAVGDTRGRLGGFADRDDTRNISRADITNQRYNAYMNRPKKPSIWETILGGALQAGGQLGGAAITAGAI